MSGLPICVLKEDQINRFGRYRDIDLVVLEKQLIPGPIAPSQVGRIPAVSLIMDLLGQPPVISSILEAA
jgi:hypothetical protein